MKILPHPSADPFTIPPESNDLGPGQPVDTSDHYDAGAARSPQPVAPQPVAPRPTPPPRPTGYPNVDRLLVPNLPPESQQFANEPDEKGRTPLDNAITSRDPACVEFLLNLFPGNDGVDSNQPTEGRPPLNLAVILSRPGQTDIVELLLQHDAKPNQTNAEGQTPLHIAAETGRSDIIDLLRGKGADIGRRDDDAFDALQIAAGAGHLDATITLLTWGREEHFFDQGTAHQGTALNEALAWALSCASSPSVALTGDAEERRDEHIDCVAALLFCGAQVPTGNQPLATTAGEAYLRKAQERVARRDALRQCEEIIERHRLSKDVIQTVLDMLWPHHLAAKAPSPA